ncbi:site-specific integrase [Apibacter muscae]|uniref:site-specific integrase n=1 Tax=Apibacter muscae TaxID=2509004 RepID=UPI0011AD2915|nr:site-specific integrase [Apibacter muscae]TWP23096.1 site-specific integrase [Apibacter muscae]
MKINKLSILFLLERSKINKQGKCPIKCRITYNNNRKPFSTGLFIYPDNWNNKHQKTEPPNEENTFINTQLSLIKQQINQAFLFLQVQEIVFDVEDIYLKYKGKDSKVSKTLLEVFDLHNERMEKLIGKEYTQSTYNKFKEAKNHVKNFIKYEYNKNNFLLEDINLKFLQDFDYYLKINKNQKQITINKSIQRVKKIIKLAIAEGFITTDPFLLYKPKRVENRVVYLTQEELSKLENYTFSQTRLQQVADMFIFCCYTGLAYQEMSTLESKHIIKGFNGNKWIKMYRQKTQKEISIPLLPKSTNIIEKYSSQVSTYLLPSISNQKFNSYLKEISDIVGINKNLTHHIARKTFATTVLLYNDVPMEIVSELLGHSKITITQEYYAKVVQKKVSEHIEQLIRKLDKK